MTRKLTGFAAGVMLALTWASSAGAFEFKAYDASAVQKVIASGKPVVVHVFAPWCLQCRAQQTILERLSTDASFDGVAFYRVDYDKQKDAVKTLGVPRSTLIAYKDGEEVAKMSWGTSTNAVLGVLETVE